MKILWFAETYSSFSDGNEHLYNGCGWIESLASLVSKSEGIDLAIAFFYPRDEIKTIKDDVTYYPITRLKQRVTPFRSLLANWSGRLLDPNIDNQVQKVISDFEPDIVQVFGTEGSFAKIQELTDIPVVIHLQGLINPYLNAYFPGNQCDLRFLLNKIFIKENLLGASLFFNLLRFSKKAKREAAVLEQMAFVMGRTHWDKMLAELFNPQVRYFHIDEVLREPFYEKKQNTTYKKNPALRIVSTLSPTIYKGIDVVLKTAYKMRNMGRLNFEWIVIGLDENDKLLKHFEKTEKISHKNVGITCVGRKNATELPKILCDADVYVHPSYIDNSPNSICEAQLLGLPTIACDVGGVKSLISHENTGFLVPSNGVFEILYYLKKLAEDEKLREFIGRNAAAVSAKRHNKLTILKKSMKHTRRSCKAKARYIKSS